jgi:hypothetical protein
MGPMRSDYNKWLITLTVITLRGYHCVNNFKVKARFSTVLRLFHHWQILFLYKLLLLIVKSFNKRSFFRNECGYKIVFFKVRWSPKLTHSSCSNFKNDFYKFFVLSSVNGYWMCKFRDVNISDCDVASNSTK